MTEKEQAEDTKKPLDTSQKTTGEKYFERLRFGIAEAFILGATAVIAYTANYGPKSNWNVFKSIQDKFNGLLKRVSEKGDTGKLVAGAAASTMVTFHGGNAFAPFMKWFNNSKAQMVHHFNEKYGKPGETDIGDERMKQEPTQSWGDVIKGRLVAWATVFTAFVSADLIARKDPKSGERRSALLEDWAGKTLASLTKDGERIAKLSPSERLHKPEMTNKTYKFGRILALDIFATTAAIVIWNAISKISASKRIKSNDIPDELEYQHVPVGAPESSAKFAEHVKPREAKSIAAQTPSFAQRIDAQQAQDRGAELAIS